MSGVLEIVAPGLATSLQDRGRPGLQRYGIPPAGALDPEGLAIANALVGNPVDMAALEIRMLGPTLRAADAPVRVAVAGAAVAMALTCSDGSVETVAGWRSVTLAPGETLTVGALREGATAYLAAGGGFGVAAVMGSASTLARAGLGGIEGRALAAGDRLRVPGMPGGPERMLPAPPGPPPSPLPVRLVLGPQDDHFTAEAIETLLSASWRVSTKADRMGLRLEGPRLQHRPPPKGADIVSDGIVTGAVQVPASGQPILLLVDRQTSGGYAKIAAAVTADLPGVGRLGPGALIRFEAVEASAGAAQAAGAARRLEALLATIRPWRSGGIDVDALWRENLIQPPIGVSEDGS